jgi:nitroreductase
MMQNKVLQCIHTRRSVRDYQNKLVPDDIIRELLQAAVMAPSANNTQPWHFTIVSDKKTIDYLAKRVSLAWEKEEVERKFGFKLGRSGSVFFNAPLLIVISGPKDYYWLKDDVNLAVENMFLAAHSLGLGSCWIGYAKALNFDQETKDKLGIPGDFEIAAPLIFGYPQEARKEIPPRTPNIIRWIR